MAIRIAHLWRRPSDLDVGLVMRTSALFGTVLLAIAPAQLGHAAANHRLQADVVIGLDATSSIRVGGRWELQVDGVAAAIESPRVLQTLQDGPGVAVAVVEWVNCAKPRAPVGYVNLSPTPKTADRYGGCDTTIDWIELHNENDAHKLAERIRRMTKVIDGYDDDQTAIEYMTKLFDTAPPAQRRVIDFSSDDASDIGAKAAVMEAAEKDIIVNGLPIAAALPTDQVADLMNKALLTSFVNDICFLPGSFCITAKSFEDFARAMIMKFSAEIS
jgi:hypothetical protein